jgi:hypothetical protein
MTSLTNYQQWQLEKKGNILPEWNDGIWPTETVEPDGEERINTSEQVYVESFLIK